MLAFIDRHWLDIFKETRDLFWDGIRVIAFINCEYFSNYIAILWFSTRTKIEAMRFFWYSLVGTIFEYPKCVIWIRIYVGIVDSIELGNFWRIFDQITWYEAVGWCVIAGSSTLYVHGNHIRWLYQDWLCKGQEDRRDMTLREIPEIQT